MTTCEAAALWFMRRYASACLPAASRTRRPRTRFCKLWRRLCRSSPSPTREPESWAARRKEPLAGSPSTTWTTGLRRSVGAAADGQEARVFTGAHYLICLCIWAKILRFGHSARQCLQRRAQLVVLEHWPFYLLEQCALFDFFFLSMFVLLVLFNESYKRCLFFSTWAPPSQNVCAHHWESVTMKKIHWMVLKTSKGTVTSEVHFQHSVLIQLHLNKLKFCSLSQVIVPSYKQCCVQSYVRLSRDIACS